MINILYSGFCWIMPKDITARAKEIIGASQEYQAELIPASRSNLDAAIASGNIEIKKIKTRIDIKLKAFIKIAIWFTLILPILTPISASAKDFGRVAQDFKIAEESFIEMIKRKLDDVDIEKHQKEQENIASERVNNPTAIDGIFPATESRTFYYDPTYTVTEDIKLPCNKILHRAGTKVNPLAHIDLERQMYFVDAREEKQIDWLIEELKGNAQAQNSESHRDIKLPSESLNKSEYQSPNKELDLKANPEQSRNKNIQKRVILVGGSPLKLEEQLNINVYFDQFGEITSKFGIKAIPAIAIQDGLKIKIEEVAL